MPSDKDQVNALLEDEPSKLLTAYVKDFGGSRSGVASEVLNLCLPLFIAIRRQKRMEEREEMQRALETVLGKPSAESPQQQKSVLPARRKA